MAGSTGTIQRQPIATDEQQQHVEFYRKLLLRKRLSRWAEPGPAYVPFIGDGDIAVELYGDRKVYGADLDYDRVAVAEGLIPGAEVVCRDCDSWPFPGLDAKFALADFDAYADPYTSFRSFWTQAEKRDRLLLFFTDGRRQGLMRTGSWTKPDGTKVRLAHRSKEKAAAFNFYLPRHIWPWFDDFIVGWRVIERYRYLRGMMLYWGAAIERT